MWSKKELIDKQAQFWVLMAQGSTLTAACEAIGVHGRTTYPIWITFPLLSRSRCSRQRRCRPRVCKSTGTTYHCEDRTFGPAQVTPVVLFWQKRPASDRAGEDATH
jgi:hypothetical protein